VDRWGARGAPKNRREEEDRAMAFPVRGATVVITGAAGGIGAALALNLAMRGANLALADRNAEGLATIAAEARAKGVRVSTHLLDVTDKDAMLALPEAVLAEHDRVSVLVNNAGVALAGTFAEISIADIEWLFDINFWAPVRLTKAFMYVLEREPAAHIVNISSLFGLIAPPGQTAYSAAKFALRGFSESLRHELDGSPITLTVVHPGGVRTDIANSARTPQGLDPEMARIGKARINKLLRMPPAEAAEQIAHAIEQRARRLVIGGDARMADRIQRLFPASYWNYMNRQAGAARRAPAPEPSAHG
jgi:short-subunit dehydrogenase